MINRIKASNCQPNHQGLGHLWECSGNHNLQRPFRPGPGTVKEKYNEIK